jgi:general secretion pathway protein C
MDALARRWFPGVVVVLIAVAAYFQASGLSSLVAEQLTVPAAHVPAAASAVPTSEDALHHTSAAAILSRNPFDSVTGPLDGTPIELPHSTPGPRPDDPYADAACAAARVTFIAASEDHDWSFAVIAPDRDPARLYRRGDPVGGRTVLHVAWDRVWLVGEEGRCQLELHAERKPAATPPTVTPQKPKGRRSPLPPEIASKIHKISETEFNVDRSAIDLVLERQAELMKSARIAPLKKNGEVIGVKMQRIASGSLLDTLGIKQGDVIRTINGLSLADPEKALQAYARLRTTDRLQVVVQRGGKDTTIDLHIR